MKNSRDLGIDKVSGKEPVYAQNQVKARILAISLAFFVGLALMALKFYVYRITGSSAVLSDALESIINVVASAFALGSILVAAKPPDESHPYGHGKIENFSAGFEGALIILAALGVFITGWSHLLHPRPLPQLEKGLLILLGVSSVNFVLGLGLIRVGKRADSLALLADGKHLLADVYTTAGVLLGLFLVHMTGWYWLDGAIACLVGIHILFSGSKLVRQSFSGLMDAAEPDLLREISELLVKHRKDIWIDIHELKALRSGNLLHIDLHLILPRELTLEEAHREAKELEKIMVTHFGGRASVLIHMDPCIDPDCPVCRNHECGLRSVPEEGEASWDLEGFTLQGGARKR